MKEQEISSDPSISSDLEASWTLITVTYNSAAKLSRYWKKARPSNVEWIVIDNASTDSTVETATTLGARVIALESNLGFSAANNVGLAHSSSEYVAFVNPDAEVNYSTLPELARISEESGGIVSPQLLNDDLSLQPNGRGMPRMISKVNNRLHFSKKLEQEYTVFAQNQHTKNVFWFIGAAVCGKRSVIEKLNGWSEDYFLYYEDKDICCRAHIAGLPVLLHGPSTWVHGWARETSSIKLKPWLYEIRSALTFYAKYPELFFGILSPKSRFSTASKNSNTQWTGSSK